VKVQARPFLLADHFVASSGTIEVPPSLKPTRLLNIWSVARSDGPSETSAGSSSAGSDSVPKTNVVVARLDACAPPASALTTSATPSATRIFFFPALTQELLSLDSGEYAEG